MNRCRSCGHLPNAAADEPPLIDMRCCYCLDAETDGPLWQEPPDTDDREDFE